jgi:hypothetical protein
MAATLVAYITLDLLALSASIILSSYPQSAALLLYLPFHAVVEFSVMRLVRLIAVLQELFFRSSFRDPYVPARVMRQAERR